MFKQRGEKCEEVEIKSWERQSGEEGKGEKNFKQGSVSFRWKKKRKILVLFLRRKKNFDSSDIMEIKKERERERGEKYILNWTRGLHARDVRKRRTYRNGGVHLFWVCFCFIHVCTKRAHIFCCFTLCTFHFFPSLPLSLSRLQGSPLLRRRDLSKLVERRDPATVQNDSRDMVGDRE